MVNFELIDPADATQPVRRDIDIETWCEEIARKECAAVGIREPRINFRYSRPRPARTTRRQISIAYGRQLLEKYGPEYVQVVPGDNPCEEMAFTTETYFWVSQRSARPAHKPSSGTTWKRPVWNAHIAVTFGTDETDRRMVFLHELAHWLSDIDDNHNTRFWKRAFHLYDKYGIDREHYLQREGDYKKTATRVAHSTGRIHNQTS